MDISVAVSKVGGTPCSLYIQGAHHNHYFLLPEVPMTSLVARSLLPLGFAAVLFGCKSAQRSTDADNSPPPSSSELTANDIERAPGQSIEEILRGRVAGVTVSRTEGGIAVRIRGASSIYGNNEPLYVIDGVAIQAGAGGTLTGLDPYDIESIEVLKDPADTAMYGMRGANGVIVIKTKRAARKKSPS
jgi:TonB-dependent SusC/RagA subfamily outer membrane receptor